MKKILTYACLLFITALILINPKDTVSYALSGLGVCYEIIIPSLFPFFVCSGLLIHSGFCEILSRFFRPVMKPLFNVGGAGSAAFILGIISGYPLGAHTACELFENSYLSKAEAERLLAFCSNSGPLFILSAVGLSMYHSIRFGILLYISHILSAITVGIIMRFYKKNSHHAPALHINTADKSFAEIFSCVLSNSINSILTVSGAVVFCSIVSRLFLELIPIHGVLHSVVLGIMEFVSGLSELSGASIPTAAKLCLSSLIVGFAGISVHLQVIAVVSRYRLSLKPYFLGKIFHGLFSALYTYIGFKFMVKSVPIFANGSLGYAFFTSSVFVGLCVCISVGLCIGLSFLLFLKESKEMRRTFRL